MDECGGQYALAGSILISVIAAIGTIFKICASKGLYCESNCAGNPCICDTNKGRPVSSAERSITVSIPEGDSEVSDSV